MTTRTVQMVDLTCWCGMPFSAPRDLYDEQTRQKARGQDTTSIYCPIGHQVEYGPDQDYERLRQRAERAERAETRVKAQLDQTEASLRAQKGATTKLKNRIAKGVCPCCHRTFANVARHMQGQHPDFIEGAP